MVETANTIWADGPASAPLQPDKAKIRAWGSWLESFVTAIGANSGSVYATRAALYSDLVHGPNSMAWVVDDPTAGYNGIYQKTGASGTGSWSRIADLPYSFITATDVGTGTPNAIIATSSLPISPSALVMMGVYEANTGSPVTVVFNGGPTLTIKTNTGNDVAPGGLTAGMQLFGVVAGSTFRLVSDQVSAAVVAAAEAAANAAAASASDADTSAGGAADSAALASRWATEAEDVPVLPGLYSAYHWAMKAAATVTGGIAAAIHAATTKAALDDADEMGLADSAASWGLKKFTLANLISSIFKTARTIANAQFAAASFKLFNAAGTPRALTLNLAALTADRAITMPDRAVDLGNVPAAAAFISAPFTAALGSNGLISHGLPSAPKKLSAYVVLTATVSAMSAGDVLKADYGVVASTAYGVQLSIPSGNTTQIKYQVTNGGISTVLNATGASATGVPSASGQIIIIAEL
ncbi:hypothetical protein [Shinella zoogloeoides]|uniref:hypothetical protein n=1 Tax=Shinella zoogloeoides TaxID=352475 RepID=UPI00299EA941|nr:hypothetical protein [Shinella zoogloeoides]WPE22513.1 hypothetical protein ShzoTeo12_37290 [Shinella zoogloeoides]